MTDLRFIGDWPLPLGLAVALLLATAAWLYYRRETRPRADIYGWLLPGLRAFAIVMLVMMLTGPVLHHRWIAGQLARILVLVDSSKSMDVTDASMTPGRKLLNAAQLGYLSDELLPADLLAAQKALTQTGLRNLPPQSSEEKMLGVANQLLDDLQTAYNRLESVKFDSSMFTIVQKGSILYEYWNNVHGTDLNAIQRAEGYPDKPSGAMQMPSCQGRVDWSDNYAARLCGYVYPPKTGDYIFWIASDDQGWLFLSTDDNPANKRLIARVPNWVPINNWDQSREQKSEPIRLQAGRRYYIEALHIEGSGSDHVGVGWQMPDGGMQRPIDGRHLSPFRLADSRQPYLTTRKAALEQFQDELLRPARDLAKAAGNTRIFSARYSELLVKAAFWQRQLQSAFEQWADKLSQSRAEDVRQAISQIDQMSRLERIRRLLLEGDEPLLAGLAQEHNVDLATFSDAEVASLWHGLAGRTDDVLGMLLELSVVPAGEATNVGLGLDTAIAMSQAQTDAEKKSQGSSRLAAVVFSDGRHNYGKSPVQLAKICGSRGIPVFTVGVGSLRKPGDIAVVGVEVPKSVYFKDRVKGKILLRDNMPEGQSFVLKITCEDQTLWEEQLKTTGLGQRFVEYDFAIEKFLEETLKGKDRELRYESFALTLRAAVAGLKEEDAEPRNDSQLFRTRSIFRKNRVLILDGRPRWEYRYIRNLLDRDEKWEVTALLVDPTARDGGIRRGERLGEFPSGPELLYNYDLIIIGDFPAKLFNPHEIEWIRDAVSLRGIGLIFVDGLRRNLQGYADTPLAEVIPVRWTGAEPIRNPQSLRLTEKGVLRLTEQGTDMAALVLSSGDKTNEEIWASLQPPHWLASIEDLPGAEVLVEAVLRERQVPAVVFRRYGAGKVLFTAFDETWRWRYRVADEYHQRYWNQMADLIMAEPFAVSDRFVSIDAGALVYTPGQTALIRAKVRDAEGKPVTQATVKANVFRDGQKVASVPLNLDKDSGEFHGHTATLQPGEYEVKIEVLGYPEEQMLAKAQFCVQRPQAGELAQLDCDQELLEQIASGSGGEFFREEDARSLADRLKPLSEGKVVESDTALWQSYFWFAVVVGLLTIEWILRKKAGLL